MKSVQKHDGPGLWLDAAIIIRGLNNNAGLNKKEAKDRKRDVKGRVEELDISKPSKKIINDNGR